MLLKWAIIFGILSLVAGFFGFSGVSSSFSGIAKGLFFIFLILVLVFVVLGFMVV